MDAIQVAGLLSAPQQPQLQAQIDALPALGPEATRVLISGVPHSGKTSLLFHLSCRTAAGGARVVWLCSQARLEQSPPLLPRGARRTDPWMELIAFKYVSDLAGLRRYGAALHLLPQPPDLLIVDDLSDLAAETRLDPGRGARDSEVTKALAVLVDALEHWRESAGRVCRLAVSDAAGDDGPRGLYLLSRWFHAVIGLSGAPPGALTLQVAPGPERYVPAALSRARVHYSVSPGGLQAEAITL